MLRNGVLAFVFALGSIAIPASLKSEDASLSQKWVDYGQRLVAQMQYDAAIKAFSTAARADLHYAPAYKGLGNAFYYKKDYANALRYYKFAYQLNPADSALANFIPRLEAAAAQSSVQSNAQIAARFYNQRSYDQAIQYYNAAIGTNPNDAAAWQGLGNCYYAKQNKDEAVKAYQKAIQLNPQNTALANFLARYSPESAEAVGVKVQYGPRDWGQPLWRSAILPGWGQIYNGQNTKGYLLMGTNVLLLGGTVATYIIGSNAEATYESTGAGGDFDDPYNTWAEMANLNHIFYIGFGVVYAFTLVDAIFNGKREPLTTAANELNQPLQVGAIPELDGAYGAKYRLLQF
jgi:tetratricopeptide (TPR) repeat protein